VKPRRRFLHLAAGAIALPFTARLTSAQAYPNRSARIVVAFAPGGPQDILARLMGQWLSQRLGQPFIVDNRPGDAGNIGTEAVVNAPPDGYTLLMVGPPNAINASLFSKLNFNFVRDIAPIAAVVRVPHVMLVKPSFPAANVHEFIAHAQATPRAIKFASAGVGSGVHLAGELFNIDRTKHAACALSGSASGYCGSGQWADRCNVRYDARFGRIHKVRKAACTGRDHRNAIGGAAGIEPGRRCRAGFRGEFSVRSWSS
jgi:tripartite-type tricarboxylate transporter receptor subunit TctC